MTFKGHPQNAILTLKVKRIMIYIDKTLQTLPRDTWKIKGPRCWSCVGTYLLDLPKLEDCHFVTEYFIQECFVLKYCTVKITRKTQVTKFNFMVIEMVIFFHFYWSESAGSSHEYLM
uniref:Uncharacterized protein n=1 Tax=Cacopsylla melanoneura TaxID=428564 RepID=A0A8D9C1B9_9HEMI